MPPVSCATSRRKALAVAIATTTAGLTMLALPASSMAAPGVEITVSAAASLTDAFTEVAQAFERQAGGTKVQLNFAASGVLLGQLRQGAPVDVLATADEKTMDAAATAGLVDQASRVDFAANSLVLITPVGSAAPANLHALTDPQWKRIAIGTAASVPAGAYAQSALERAGLATALEPRMVYGANVRQVLTYVARGEVDAGFVYRTDAMARESKVRIAFEVPLDKPVLYPIARVTASQQSAAAQAFVDFTRTDAARQILQRHGFKQP